MCGLEEYAQSTIVRGEAINLRRQKNQKNKIQYCAGPWPQQRRQRKSGTSCFLRQVRYQDRPTGAPHSVPEVAESLKRVPQLRPDGKRYAARLRRDFCQSVDGSAPLPLSKF